MRFYLSAKWELKDTVARMRDRIISCGHTVPVDWTLRAFQRDYDTFEKSREFADEEARAILNSDILIHLSNMSGRGKYVDLGIAIAGSLLQTRPKIYIVGSKANESQFYFHPIVNRILNDNPLKALEDILDSIND